MRVNASMVVGISPRLGLHASTARAYIQDAAPTFGPCAGMIRCVGGGDPGEGAIGSGGIFGGGSENVRGDTEFFRGGG